ncbi:tyrosine-type recombinase/integrase [Candidatus Parcubacteria bacterium]|nr:tyrosine-type recombinase/integrase [Candidatus Parcubacteria bacterium]
MSKIHLPNFDDYLLDLQVNNYSKETLYNYERDLTVFENYINKSKVEFKKINKKEILRYKAFLTSSDRKTANKNNGEVYLGAYSINRMLSSLRSYFKYLVEIDFPVPIPPEAIKMIKTEKKKSQVAELDELVALLEAPTKFEKNKKIGIRNRAILEVFFATGMRISELINLEVDKINKEGKIFILGKGKKERFVYLTPRSIKHLNAYMKIRNTGSPFVFVPYRGLNASELKKKISPNYIQSKIKAYREMLGITVPTSAHSLRHGFATYLAESGANPAAIQILLGHESLDTTTRYVHASDRYAQKSHKKFHPLNK